MMKRNDAETSKV